jgi:flavin-dependent dehydrogenase
MLDQEVSGLGAVTTQTVTRMQSYIEQGTPEETACFPGRMIDRAAFDRRLALAAAEAGTDCRYGVGVRAIDPDGTVRATNGSALRARLVIGADGPHSKVGAAIGEVNRDLVETRQITVPLRSPSDATDIFLRAGFVGGYGWLFPKGRHANLGIGVSAEARQRLKPLLAALWQERIDRGQIDVGARCHTGGAIPVGGPLRGIGWLDRTPVLLAGDALGLTNPITGAGISSAVQSGKLAGCAAGAWLDGEAQALKEYDEEIHDFFGPSLARARKHRRALWGDVNDSDYGEGPSPAALRNGWIAYPQYWTD